MIYNAAEISEKVIKTNIAIVGSGAAGAILAYQLSSVGIDCLVLEEGSHFDKKSLSREPNQITKNVYRDSCFFATLGKPVIPVPLGKCLGGTTVINSGTCFRTPIEKLQQWRKVLGLDHLKIENFETSFEFLKELLEIEPARYELMSQGNLKFKLGLERLCLEGKPLLRNAKHCEGNGFCCYGCPPQAKQSMNVSVIPKASEQGAKFLVNAKVQKINLKGANVESLLICAHDKLTNTKRYVKVIANKYIISAGSIFSPSLLLKSGIPLKHIGNYLTIHPTTKVLALFEEKIYGWRGIPQALYYDGLKEEGMTFEGVFLPPDVIGATLPSHGSYEEIIENYDKVAAFGALIHDSQYGKVKHYPLIGTKAFYSLTQQDVEKFKKAITFMAKVYFEAGAQKVYTFINRKENVIQSKQDIERFANLNLKNTDIESMGFHPLGTCRMGLDKKSSVVDQNCIVHGTENLYVCDGSIVPTMLGVNPQITIMSFAHQLAKDLILQYN